jgi:hypothetical protein
MNTVVTDTTDLRRARRAFVWVGLVAPVLIAFAGVALLLAWLPDLPERITTHWGPSGPDGFAAPILLVWMQLALGLTLPLLMTVPVLFMMRGAWGPVCRFLAAMSLGTAALIAVAFVGSAAMQRESVDVGFGIGAVIAAAFAIMVVLGAIGWSLQPKTTTMRPSELDATGRLQLADGERAAWFGTAAMGSPGVIALLGALLVMIATTVWTMALDSGAGWLLALVTLLLVALVAVTLVFRVRVNAAGLRVRSVLGWPRWNIAASEITDVKVVQVNPMAEFGGWGLRIAVDGRMGVVLRTGEALQVTRTSGRVFVVTIDDARTAASVLTTAMKGTDS